MSLSQSEAIEMKRMRMKMTTEDVQVERDVRAYFTSLLRGYPSDLPEPSFVVYNGDNAKIDPERRCRADARSADDDDPCRSVAYTTVRGSRRRPRPEVVVSPRLLRMEKDIRDGVVVHEAGHVVDFAAFGAHYKLRGRRDVIGAWRRRGDGHEIGLRECRCGGACR